MKTITGFVFWFLSQLVWKKVLTTTNPPSVGVSYNPTPFPTSQYATLVGTLPPAYCLISLKGDEGTFGDKLTLETPLKPSESPTPTTVPTSSPLPSATTPTTTPTSPPETTGSCVKYKKWKITVRKEHFVEMTLESINLGPGACLYNMFLIVKDADAMSSNVLHIQCEADAVPRRIWSSSNVMVVERYGRSSRSTANTGFHASYQAIPLSKGESPNFQSKVENVTILSSSSSNLLCQAKRGPAPVITWYKSRDGITHQILQNSTSVIYNYEVYSRRLDEVKCVARNSFGSDDKRLLVNTQDCSKICSCYVPRSDPFWIRVDCMYMSYLGVYTVPQDIPDAAKYLLFRWSDSLRHIIPGSMGYLTNLQYLVLESTWLSNLTTNAFLGLKKLKYLEITKHISKPFTILEGAFNDLSSLNYLSIQHNRISDLLPKVFNGLLSLKELILSDNDLYGISVEINKRLEKLDLRSNKLTGLFENSFRGSRSSVKYLDLRSNSLTTISAKTFQNFSSLRELYLADNRLIELSPEIFQDLTDLRILDLSRNKITQLPGNIFHNLKNLETLDLSQNELSELPGFIFFGLKRLKTLYLQDNLLKEIPLRTFEHLPGLRIL